MCLARCSFASSSPSCISSSSSRSSSFSPPFSSSLHSSSLHRQTNQSTNTKKKNEHLHNNSSFRNNYSSSPLLFLFLPLQQRWLNSSTQAPGFAAVHGEGRRYEPKEGTEKKSSPLSQSMNKRNPTNTQKKTMLRLPNKQPLHNNASSSSSSPYSSPPPPPQQLPHSN